MKPTKRYLYLESKRALCRALMGGTEEMRQQTSLTPQHPAESNESYKIRINSTTLYNGLSDTIKKQAGKVFSEPVILNNDVPESIVDITKNIDGQGRNITTFFFDAFIIAMTDGISFIYTDYPRIEREDGQVLTDLDVQSMGLRSNTLLINSTDLISIKSATVNGLFSLTEARIKEVVEDESGEEVKQIRVLNIGLWSILREDEKGEWVEWDSGTSGLNYIPLEPIYTNRVGFFEGLPPLQPLAELNLAHWRSSSEQARALSMARFDMLFMSGIQSDEEIGKIAPDVVFKVSDPQAKCTNVGTSGEGIVQGRLDILDFEKRMESAGMTVRVESAVGSTATAARLNSSDADSALLSLALSLENSINNVLKTIGDYTNISGGTVNINVKTEGKKPEGTAEDISKLFVAGAISHELLMKELIRRNVIDDEIDIEEEKRLMLEQSPMV